MKIDPPPKNLPDLPPLKQKLLSFRRGLDVLINTRIIEDNEDVKDCEIARIRLSEIEDSPKLLIRGRALTKAFEKLERQ